jgi:hypothetical protein
VWTPGEVSDAKVRAERLDEALQIVVEGEEEGGPRLFAAYLSVDRVHEEGSTESIGNDASRHCYKEVVESTRPNINPGSVNS